MENVGPVDCTAVTILDVLGVDLCARAILDRVPVADLARSERVSRWWKSLVCYYLKTCRTLSYEGFRYTYNIPSKSFFTNYHRTILIDNFNHSLPLVRKTLNKWGPYIVKVDTDIGEDTYLDIIVSECPNLKHIEIVKSELDKPRLLPLTQMKNLKQLKHIVLRDFISFSECETIHSDSVLGELFQDISCENITISGNVYLTGSFLKSLTSDSLKSLSITSCLSLRVPDLLSAIDNMRNLTSLELEEGCKDAWLNDVNLLLLEMPQLEELILSFLNYTVIEDKEVWNQAFSRLVNLKRLTLWNTRHRTNDTFMELLARTCKKLEYLRIEGFDQSLTARGVMALCRTSPSARVAIRFPFSVNVKDYFVFLFFAHFKINPLMVELAALGCVEMTLEWFRAAVRNPRGRDLSLNASAVQGDPQELKLGSLSSPQISFPEIPIHPIPYSLTFYFP